MKEITLKLLQDNFVCVAMQTKFMERLDGAESLSIAETFSWLKQIEKLDWAIWLLPILLNREQRLKLATYALKLALRAIERECLYEWNEQTYNEKMLKHAVSAATCLTLIHNGEAYIAHMSLKNAIDTIKGSNIGIGKEEFLIINYGLQLLEINAPILTARAGTRQFYLAHLWE